jgi:hypothetical protein
VGSAALRLRTLGSRLLSRGVGVDRIKGVPSEGSVSGVFTSGVGRRIASGWSGRVSGSLEMFPVGSEFRLGDEGIGDEIFLEVPRDVVNKFAAAWNCCTSNSESFRTSITLWTSGDSGVPGAEGMGLIRVRFELEGVVRAYRLAARVIAGLERPLLGFPLA